MKVRELTRFPAPVKAELLQKVTQAQARSGWAVRRMVLGAYSRYVVHWELLTTRTVADVLLVIQEVLERTGATPQVVTDNGAQFTAAEFKDVVRRFALDHIRIRTYQPESNGLVESFHCSTREAIDGHAVDNITQARAIIAAWVRHYNKGTSARVSRVLAASRVLSRQSSRAHRGTEGKAGESEEGTAADQ